MLIIRCCLTLLPTYPAYPASNAYLTAAPVEVAPLDLVEVGVCPVKLLLLMVDGEPIRYDYPLGDDTSEVCPSRLCSLYGRSGLVPIRPKQQPTTNSY